MKSRKDLACDNCRAFKKDRITTCGDCDREYIMIDVRFYRALRNGTFVLKQKIKRLESKENRPN
jgi:hypothetical protein